MRLSRLLITGPVDIQTPQCVLEEIYRAHELGTPNWDDIPGIVNLINTSPRPTLREASDYSLVNFVNPDVSWPNRDVLEQALTCLIQYMNDYYYELPIRAQIGWPRPRTNHWVPPSVLYRIYKHQGYVSHFNTTLGELWSAITRDIPPEQASPVTLPSTPRPESEPSGSFPISVYQQLSDVSYLRRRLTPISDNEAIILAGLEFGINLNDHPRPIVAYQRLCDGTETLLSWPYYRDCFDGRMELAFYDTLGLSLESQAPLELLEECENAYQALQVQELLETFHPPRPGDLVSPYTPIHQSEVSLLPPDQLIYYGVGSERQFRVVTVSELRDVFMHYQCLVNPWENYRPLGNLQIFRLKWVAETRHHDELGLTIRLLENHGQSYDQELIEISRTQREQLIQGLEGLRRLALVMREETSLNRDLLVQDEIRAFNIIDREVFGCLGNLRLLRYNQGHFQASLDEDDGLTIKERLAIIEQGQTPSACLRLSSDWLLSSAHYYLRALGYRISSTELRRQ